jgi:uncharacterized membrane protein YeaQ/YmgE (transglycosylase-associated protein family)
MPTAIGARCGVADHGPNATQDDERRRQMAVLGWIAVGLVTAVLASGLRRGDEGRRLLVGRYATGMVGALVGGLVAVAAGVGELGDFFHSGTWLIALGGAVLALVVFELTRSGRAGRDSTAPRSGSWPRRRAGGESERLDRNW